MESTLTPEIMNLLSRMKQVPQSGWGGQGRQHPQGGQLSPEWQKRMHPSGMSSDQQSAPNLFQSMLTPEMLQRAEAMRAQGGLGSMMNAARQGSPSAFQSMISPEMLERARAAGAGGNVTLDQQGMPQGMAPQRPTSGGPLGSIARQLPQMPQLPPQNQAIMQNPRMYSPQSPRQMSPEMVQQMQSMMRSRG